MRVRVPTKHGWLLVAVGVQGMAAQLVILRELMAGFAGNELVVGALLGCWVGSEALGAAIAGKLRSGRAGSFLMPAAILAALTALLAPFGVALARQALAVMPGESVGVQGMLAVTLAAVLLPALAHGALFVLGTVLLADGGAATQPVGRGYLLEGAGTALSGLAVGLALAGGAGSVLVVAVASLPMLVLAAVTDRRRLTRVAAAVAAGCALLAAVGGAALETSAWQRHWPGQRVVSLDNSVVGKVIALERAGQRLVLQDGVPVFGYPRPDVAADEELVHLPMLAQGAAGRVLVVGPGYGLMPELAKYPGAAVTLVQPDARLARAVCAADPELERLLAGPGFAEVIVDPRRFLVAGSLRFDVIIVTGVSPASLAASRLSTREFFAGCRRRLAEGGVLAVTAAGPAAVRLAEEAQLARTRGATLRAVFGRVVVLSADRPLFLAGDGPFENRPESLAARLERAGPGNLVLTPEYLVALLDPFRQEQLAALLGGPQPAPVSTDRRPRELGLALALAGRMQSPRLARLQAVLTTRLVPILVGALGALLLLALVGGIRRGPGFTRPLGVFTSGLAGAGVATLAVFGYQLRYGSLYAEVGLLLAAFMFGTVAGGAVGTARAGRRGAGWLFAAAQATLAGCAGLTALLPVSGSRVEFGLVLFVAGWALGVQFPIAGSAGPTARTAGRLLALDLAGGVLGSVGTAALVVPELGLGAAALALAGVVGSGLAGHLPALPGTKQTGGPGAC